MPLIVLPPSSQSGEMTALVDFYRYIKPGCIGAPEPLIDSCLLRAAIEFCERTRMWRVQASVSVTGDDPIAAPVDTAIHKVETARFAGQALQPIGVTDLDALHPTQDWLTLDKGTPRYITQLAPNSLVLVPAPTETGEVTLMLQLKPSQTAEQLPRFLFDLYQQVLADGALAEILATPGQSYTNPEMAGVYSARFQQKLDALSILSLRGQQGAPVRTRPNYF